MTAADRGADEAARLGQVPAGREALRARLLAEIPWWYSPTAHVAIPALVGLGIIAICVARLHDVRPLQLLVIPIVFVAANAVEWRAHRYVLHRRTFYAPLLYDQHTPMHHRLYITGDMALRDRREARFVLIPAYGILSIAVITLPALYPLWRWLSPNTALLFMASCMAYVLSYEWLHLAYHLSPDSAIGRLRVIAVLRRHHAIHHDPALMQRWNMNVSVPLWDLVRGTIWRGQHPAFSAAQRRED